MKQKVIGIITIISIFIIVGSLILLLWHSDRDNAESARRDLNNYSRVVTLYGDNPFATSNSYPREQALQYPKLIHPTDTKLQEELNKKIKDKFDMIVESFKPLLVSSTSSSLFKPEVYISYTPLTVNSKIISIVFRISTRTAPKEYNQKTFVFNYSIPDKKELMLSDIITTPEYQPIFIKEISDSIEYNSQFQDTQDGMYKELYTNKFLPKLDQLDKFGIRYNGLVFYFDPPDTDPYFPLGRGGYVDIEVDFDSRPEFKRLVKPELLEYLKEE